MFNKYVRMGWIVLALTVSAGAVAETDPGVHQIYEAADAGHLVEAERMVEQVLRDHPKSGKAHYVAAELFARAGNPSRAQDELDTAKRLEPGLPFAKAASVRALERELSLSPVNESSGARTRPPALALTVFAFVILAVVVWFIRRRPSAPVTTYAQRDASAPGLAPGAAPGPASSTATTVSAGAPPAASGIGSGIAGGLVSGLAVGAGVVAGEELAHHVLDGDRDTAEPVLAANEPGSDSPNSDLGGTDFGVTDGSTWNDDAGTAGDDNDWT